MSKIKKYSRKGKKSSGSRKDYFQSQKVRVAVAAAFLLGFVALCLVLLVNLRSVLLPDYTRYEEPIEELVKEESQLAEPIYNYEKIFAMVEGELLNGPQSEGWQKLPVEGNMLRLKMFGDLPHRNRLLDLSGRIAETGAPAQLDLLPRKGYVRLFWQKELRLELRYRVPIEVTSKRPQIAIIMDDMGRSINMFRNLLELDLIITPAIMPETSKATEAALLLQDAGREYMIHIPMQPKSFPRVSPGPNALLLGQPETETRRLVRYYMSKVPGAAGGNNHMGSGYTQSRAAMRVVLDELQLGAHYFIDSKTIGSSIAYDEARRMKLPTAARHIFLDNEEDVTYIRKQIRKMVRMADERGELIAICHPYSETLTALRLEMPWLMKQNVDFVSASALTKIY